MTATYLILYRASACTMLKLRISILLNNNALNKIFKNFYFVTRSARALLILILVVLVYYISFLFLKLNDYLTTAKCLNENVAVE